MRDKLRALREHTQQSAAALQRDTEAVDEVLDVRQQAPLPAARGTDRAAEARPADAVARAGAPAPRRRRRTPGGRRDSRRPTLVPPPPGRVYNDLMVSRSRLAAVWAALAVIGASVTLSARLTKQEADQFSAKLNRIVQTGNAKPVKTAKPVAAQPRRRRSPTTS